VVAEGWAATKPGIAVYLLFDHADHTQILKQGKTGIAQRSSPLIKSIISARTLSDPEKYTGF